MKEKIDSLLALLIEDWVASKSDEANLVWEEHNKTFKSLFSKADTIEEFKGSFLDYIETTTGKRLAREVV